jgi:hypothetical protein
MSPKTHWIKPGIVTAGSLLLALTLSSCSAVGNASETPTASGTPQAHGVLRDVFMCFENTSGAPVSIEWVEPGTSSNSGQGALAAGKTFCGEGGKAQAAVSFSGGDPIYVYGYNTLFIEPRIIFKNSYYSDTDPGVPSNWKQFGNESYSVGQTIVSDIQGHHFSITRGADDEWIQFSITIQD